MALVRNRGYVNRLLVYIKKHAHQRIKINILKYTGVKDGPF